MQQDYKIPLLYVYLYRNLRQLCSQNGEISSEDAICCLRKIVYKAPRIIFQEVFYELEEMNAIKIINKQKYLVLSNSYLDAQLKRIKEYVFPINPR